MPSPKTKRNCKTCGREFLSSRKTTRFCSRKCQSECPEVQKKLSEANKKCWYEEEYRQAVIDGHKNQHKGKINPCPTSLFELSSRTIRKVLTRLGLGCSRCGWKEGTSDLHHIHGRKIENPHDHSNLCLICPNCHRLVHEGKIKPEELIDLKTYIADDWKQHYYG